jgi:serine/threonine protein kinase
MSWFVDTEIALLAAPMTHTNRKTIRFRGRTEPVIESFHVQGRSYFALEKLSSRGAYRVFDPHAGPHGDYRALHLIPKSKMTRQRLEVLRRLGGPGANRNFPGIVDFVNQRGEFVVVIAWMHGTNLKSYLSAVRDGKTPRPSVSEVVRLVRGLAHGLSHYHRKTNLIHGDISPANIIITSGTSSLVLIDFGAAWPIEHVAHRSQDAYTLPYAAPERIAKQASEDFRSDMFSLTAIAYELLTLALPYDGLGGQAGTPQLMAKTAGSYSDPSRKIPSRGRLTGDILRQLDKCVGVGLKLRPDERFATSSEWLAAWDKLHMSVQKGSRLSRLESILVAGIDAVARCFSRKRR